MPMAEKQSNNEVERGRRGRRGGRTRKVRSRKVDDEYAGEQGVVE